MMRRRFWMGFIAICLVLPAWAAIDLDERIDQLVERWSRGDEAARAGVVVETLTLGEHAVAELYERLAAPSDFPGRDPGVDLPAGDSSRRSDRMISIQVSLAEPEGGSGGPAGGVRLLETPEDLLIADSAQVISAPTLAVYDGQLANVTVVEQRSYRRTFDAQGKPVEGTVNLGVMMEVRAFVDAPSERVTVDLRVVRSELAGPMGVVKTPRGSIEVPDLVKRELACTLPLRSGKRTGLMLPGSEGRNPLIVLVTAAELKQD